MKPKSWDNVESEALAINGITKEIVDEKGVNQKQAWETFTDYCNKYNKKKSFWGAPIAAGHNILGYDMHIVNRMCELYGPLDNKSKSPILFHGRDKLDLLNLCFLWFENNKELENYKLDTLRDFFGISKIGAHNAIKDVTDTAMILARFLKFHRNMAAKVTFKNVFKGN